MIMQLVNQTDPVLRLPTTEISDDEIAGLSGLISDMFATLDAAGGIGLAAPQVGINRSLFVISINDMRKVFINPTILATSETAVAEEEACLSLPGLRVKIKRPPEIKVMWTAEDGQKQIADLEGLWARCWLHEYDHLQGIMIDDRISKLSLNMARKKMIKQQKLGKRT